MSHRRLQLRKTAEALELLNLIDKACDERDVLEAQRRSSTEKMATSVWANMRRTVCFENGEVVKLEAGNFGQEIRG